MSTLSYERRRPFRLLFTPRPCQRTPRAAPRLLRGVCSEGAAWAAWHRVRKRVKDGIAKLGVYRLIGPDGEIARLEVLPMSDVGCRMSDVQTEAAA